MSQIIATGDGITVTVTCKNRVKTILFDDQANPLLLEKLHKDMDFAPPVGGTYYPRKYTMLAYYNTLEQVFFTRLDSISTKGSISTIPYRPGLIY
ncbi:MAG: hypothetical protein Q4C05_04330 [Akkermansia sp.]|nr:hypothetical protein [Akkermansia sp.]